MAILTALSLLSSDNLKVDTPPIPYLDKGVHFTFYAVAMFLGSLLMWEQLRSRLNIRKALGVMGVGLIIYGMIIEVIQGVSDTGRSAEMWDVVANILGIGFGAGLSTLLFRKVNAFNW